MRLGIGLPNTLYGVDRRLMLEWARMADAAGFDLLGTIDKPNYDSWDPLTTLAAVAAVTDRARLATTILQLPNRNEVLVAKQAAVVDQVSEGRLVLGVAVGGRRDDYSVFRARFGGRAQRFEKQIPRMRRIWKAAARSNESRGLLGPAPVQKPAPPVWIGATSERGMQRAAELGDGFVFAALGPDLVAPRVPWLRERTSAKGKRFEIAAIAYVALGDDRKKVMDRAAPQLQRYYGSQLWADPSEIILHGPPEVVAESAARFEASGIDTLVLFPEIPELDQVAMLAESVLPAFRGRESRVDATLEQTFPASDPPAW